MEHIRCTCITCNAGVGQRSHLSTRKDTIAQSNLKSFFRGSSLGLEPNKALMIQMRYKYYTLLEKNSARGFWFSFTILNLPRQRFKRHQKIRRSLALETHANTHHQRFPTVAAASPTLNKHFQKSPKHDDLLIMPDRLT